MRIEVFIKKTPENIYIYSCEMKTSIFDDDAINTPQSNLKSSIFEFEIPASDQQLFLERLSRHLNKNFSDTSLEVEDFPKIAEEVIEEIIEERSFENFFIQSHQLPKPPVNLNISTFKNKADILSVAQNDTALAAYLLLNKKYLLKNLNDDELSKFLYDIALKNEKLAILIVQDNFLCNKLFNKGENKFFLKVCEKYPWLIVPAYLNPSVLRELRYSEDRKKFLDLFDERIEILDRYRMENPKRMVMNDHIEYLMEKINELPLVLAYVMVPISDPKYQFDENSKSSWNINHGLAIELNRNDASVETNLRWLVDKYHTHNIKVELFRVFLSKDNFDEEFAQKKFSGRGNIFLANAQAEDVESKCHIFGKTITYEMNKFFNPHYEVSNVNELNPSPEKP